MGLFDSILSGISNVVHNITSFSTPHKQASQTQAASQTQKKTLPTLNKMIEKDLSTVVKKASSAPPELRGTLLGKMSVGTVDLDTIQRAKNPVSTIYPPKRTVTNEDIQKTREELTSYIKTSAAQKTQTALNGGKVNFSGIPSHVSSVLESKASALKKEALNTNIWKHDFQQSMDVVRKRAEELRKQIQETKNLGLKQELIQKYNDLANTYNSAMDYLRSKIKEKGNSLEQRAEELKKAAGYLSTSFPYLVKEGEEKAEKSADLSLGERASLALSKAISSGAETARRNIEQVFPPGQRPPLYREIIRTGETALQTVAALPELVETPLEDVVRVATGKPLRTPAVVAKTANSINSM